MLVASPAAPIKPGVHVSFISAEKKTESRGGLGNNIANWSHVVVVDNELAVHLHAPGNIKSIICRCSANANYMGAFFLSPCDPTGIVQSTTQWHFSNMLPLQRILKFDALSSRLGLVRFLFLCTGAHRVKLRYPFVPLFTPRHKISSHGYQMIRMTCLSGVWLPHQTVCLVKGNLLTRQGH